MTAEEIRRAFGLPMRPMHDFFRSQGLWRSGVFILALSNLVAGVVFCIQGDAVAGPGLAIIEQHFLFGLRGFGVLSLVLGLLVVTAAFVEGATSQWVLWADALMYYCMSACVIVGVYYFHQFSPGIAFWLPLGLLAHALKATTMHCPQ